MARPEDVDIVEAMKAANTPKEMILSWATQSDGKDVEPDWTTFRLWIERKPEMIETFAQNILWRVIDRGILDSKTRTLVTLGMAMALGSRDAVIAHCANAKGAGWTEEEIMEVAYLACYQASKIKMVTTGLLLDEAFQATANVKSRKKS